MIFAPLINDITTDTENPPELWRVKNGEISDEKLDYLESFSTIQREAYPDIVTQEFSWTVEEASLRVKRILEGLPRVVIVREDVKNGFSLQAICITRFFRFRDDLAIRITERSQGIAIDLRSKSRLGRGDLGANAERLRMLSNRLAE